MFFLLSKLISHSYCWGYFHHLSCQCYSTQSNHESSA